MSLVWTPRIEQIDGFRSTGQVAVGRTLLTRRAHSLMKACDMGRVKLRDQPAKPARDIKAGRPPKHHQ